MKTVSTEQMRELDRITIEEHGTPGAVLMERAGYGVARRVHDLAGLRMPGARFVRCVAGRGNNGGDAFVAARHLADWGRDVEVWLAAAREDVRGDAKTMLERLDEVAVPVHEMPDAAAWAGTLDALPPRETVFVDGLLGTGTRGIPREPAASAIGCLNAWAEAGAAVVSIDVPSGLDTDTGEAPGAAVRADLTVTMAFPKAGLLQGAALSCVGAVEVVDIGIPAEISAGVRSDWDLVCAEDVRSLFSRRRRAAHKGDFGHVLIVGGAAGFAGAAAMAARAAVRAGAGLVSAIVPDAVSNTVAGLVPEAMVHAGRSTEGGALAAAGLDELPVRLDSMDALLIGPGMTTDPSVLDVVTVLLARTRCPAVLDADALNVCAGKPECIRDAGRAVVITPHPGEMARLLDCSARDVQADRISAARSAARLTCATVVLKGAGSLVVSEDRAPSVVTAGNPGMATGGTGDVLAGVVVSLLGQRLPVYDAARAAAYLHGRAGDRAAWRRSQAGMGAIDVLDELPHAFAEVMAR